MTHNYSNTHGINSRHVSEHPSFTDKDSFLPRENHSMLIPSRHTQNIHEKDLSLRSVSSHKHSHYSRISQQTSYDNDPTASNISESVKSNYQAIERVLKN
jgi:hypothetical protein